MIVINVKVNPRTEEDWEHNRM